MTSATSIPVSSGCPRAGAAPTRSSSNARSPGSGRSICWDASALGLRGFRRRPRRVQWSDPGHRRAKLAPGTTIRVEVVGKLRRAYAGEPKIGDFVP